MHRSAVVVMARAPVPGTCKTRLCPPLSPEDAAALYGAFLEDIARELEAWAGNGPSDFDVVAVPVIDRAINSAPAADAGPDQEDSGEVTCSLDAYGNPVCGACSFTFDLDGEGTIDGDLDPVDYAWSVVSGSGLLSAFDGPTTSVTVSATPAVVGVPVTEVVEVQLSATDCLGAVGTDIVTVVVDCIGY